MSVRRMLPHSKYASYVSQPKIVVGITIFSLDFNISNANKVETCTHTHAYKAPSHTQIKPTE